MKCFYHENKDAVGQCQDCGKGLCKNCITEYNGLCKDCYFKNRANQIDDVHASIDTQLRNYRVDIIKSFIIGGIGFIIMLIFLLGFVKMPIDSFGALVVTIFFAFIPLGFRTLTKIFGKDPTMGKKNTAAYIAWASGVDGVSSYGAGWLIGRFLVFCVKLVIAFFIGTPSFAYLIYKFINTNKQLEQLEVNYKKDVDDFVEEMKTSDEVEKN